MEPRPETPLPKRRWTRAQVVYAVALFVSAWTLVGLALARSDAVLSDGGELAAAAFFFAFGLFTISMGYQHPNLGYYSFDRVSQVASILVLGPVAAALINGLASFVYPWHRLRKGVPPREVLYAAINNSGLMAAIVLAAGLAYSAVGGPVPLTSLTPPAIAALLVLVLGMQVLNDAGMLVLYVLGRRSLAGFFHAFSYALELGAGATAVLVAIIFNTMGLEVFLLMLVVLSVGMLALRQFADMRHKLELIVAERTQKLEEKSRELEVQATRDNLTGLFNRRYADEYLAHEMESCRRERRPLTVAFADIDFFKRVNDLHSHAMGDAVLRRVADVLRDRCRANDVLARYGGEEFLLCFPNTDLREARLVCEELRTAVERSNWAQLGLAGGVTISFGIADYRTDASAERLLNRADVRLYEAKHGGRNLVVA
ncbi:MAG TPA: diguanylate cyclase [Gammaproteobacteria bacterium]|nr:diguanylate cyclase [Gammaproteobacteria bacterium]